MIPWIHGLLFAYAAIAMSMGTIAWPLCLWSHRHAETGTVCERCGRRVPR